MKRKHPLQDVEADKYFKLHKGDELKSLEELRDALKTMDDKTFRHHVNDERNDFANWIRDIIKDVRLADDLQRLRTREKTLQRVEDRIRWLEEELHSVSPYLHIHSHVNQFLAGALLGLLVGLIIAKLIGIL